MGLDTSKVAQVVGEQMEALKNELGDVDGFEIGAVVTIVEVEGPDGSALQIRHNTANPIVTLGVLRLAEDEIIRLMRIDD